MTTPDILILLYVILPLTAGYLWLGDWLLWKCGLTRSRGLHNIHGAWPIFIAVWALYKFLFRSR